MKKKLMTAILSMAVAGSVIAGSSLTSLAYTVQPGDTLGKIAAANGTTVEQIAAYNGITNYNKIYVGQELKVSATEVKGVLRTAILAKLKNEITKNFDAKYYAEQYPDVAKALGTDEATLLRHFLTFGIWEGRQMNKNFNVNAYASAYEDLQSTFANQNAAQQILSYYQHYITYTASGVENRTITTIEKAVAAGVTVKSVSSDAESTGTVLAAPTPSVAQVYTFEAYVESKYYLYRALMISAVDTYCTSEETATAWKNAEAAATTPSEKIEWVSTPIFDPAFPFDKNMPESAEIAPITQYVFSPMSPEFYFNTAEFQAYDATVVAACAEAGVSKTAVSYDEAAYAAAYAAWEAVDTSEMTEDQYYDYLWSEPYLTDYPTAEFAAFLKIERSIDFRDFLGEWGKAIYSFID